MQGPGFSFQCGGGAESWALASPNFPTFTGFQTGLLAHSSKKAVPAYSSFCPQHTALHTVTGHAQGAWVSAHMQQRDLATKEMSFSGKPRESGSHSCLVFKQTIIESHWGVNVAAHEVYKLYPHKQQGTHSVLSHAHFSLPLQIRRRPGNNLCFSLQDLRSLNFKLLVLQFSTVFYLHL